MKNIGGDEISVEALIHNGTLKIIQVTDKKTTLPPYNVEISHIQPSKYKDTYLKKIKDYLQSLVKLLNLDNCALHPEFKIENNKLCLIELGPRLGGDFITSKLVPLSTGFNLEKEVIRIATKSKNNELKLTNKKVAIKYFNFKSEILIKSELDINFVKKYPEIHSIELNLNKGDIIPKIKNSIDRYGYFIVQSNSQKI